MSALGILVPCFVIAVGIVTAAPGKILDDELVDSCAKTFHIPANGVEAWKHKRPLPESPDEKFMCFCECIITSSKTLKDGDFQEDNIRNLVSAALTEKNGSVDQSILDSVVACGEKSAEGKCARGYAIYKCIDDIMFPVLHDTAQ